MPESAPTGCSGSGPAPGPEGPEGTAGGPEGAAPGPEDEVLTGTAALGAPDTDPRSACAAESA
jgi:hypothetical protein